MAKKTSTFDDLIFIASKLPWWSSLILAVAFGVYLHGVAAAPVAMINDVQHLQSMMMHSMFKTLAAVGQYLVPLIFVIGAITSVLGRRKRQALLNTGHAVNDFTWQEFELLVGEALRRQGYSIQETGGSGADDGIDLIARKDGEKYLVQCKHWRALQVGVPVVRELYGAMAAEGAVGGFVVTSGRFTEPAREFASGRNLKLVDGARLRRWIAAAKNPAPAAKTQAPIAKPQPEAPAPSEAPQAPACPHCRKTMVVRVARSGRNAGGDFWGCADYPKCRGIRPIFSAAARSK
ncbi:restriction endonuclease [Pseudomonas eucalypticola]|uniref:Restriction endonuclease n=1 Tax=Pseudomonas eucalypticola TaxID=2599595 RepID=A0A7D5H3N1_9PSED|nr:restriction endonuclease [Pseudomonas eucalypticola]QKZ03083.1 restriction endonuclease [Pseudomonas eucalypticola]